MRKTIFISCGQYTDAEKQLGKQIAEMVRSLTDLQPFFAEEVQDLNGLDANILGALRDCVAFITILHPRGEIKRPDGSGLTRASVWIEQEIAVATYVQRVQKRPLPIIAFKHRSIGREGIRDLLHLNPIEFTNEAEVLAELPKRLEAWKSLKPSVSDEDQSSWPDVILECQWPSLLHEPKIPGSHIVRKRPWILRNGGPGAVYDVRVHRIRFGEYEAWFPFPVRTLTDTASVYPIVCRKSDGSMIDADLESLIRNPPSGCDIQQYAVETDGIEDEEIQPDDFILDEVEISEVEIPVTISYDDKNANRFKIDYLLHYDTFTKKGEMIRAGRIKKVTLK